MSDCFFIPDANYALLLLDFVEKENKTTSGIILMSDKQDKRAEANATVIAFGDECSWKDKYKVGDRVTIALHAGQPFHKDADLTTEEKTVAERLRVVVDDDILGLLNPDISLKEWCKRQLEVAA